MRWTAKKLRNTLKANNYKLPHGYNVVKRSKINGNMSLSFLSGDSGNIKMLEARAYAREAAKNILRAKALEDEIETAEDIEFIGLDEIGNKEKRQQKKQARQEKRQERREARRGGGQSQQTSTEDEIIEDPSTPSAPTTGAKSDRKEKRRRGRGPGTPGKVITATSTKLVPSLPTRAAALPSEAKATMKTILPENKVLAKRDKLIEQKINIEKQAEASAERAEQAAEQPTGGFLNNKNLLLYGGIALAAITGIYFFTRKK